LATVLKKVQEACQIGDKNPSWMFDDGSFEKMGYLLDADYWGSMMSYQLSCRN